MKASEGGGLREGCEVHKNFKKDELLEEAQKLFFRNGIAPVGRIEEFCNFDLLDFKKESVDPDSTVGDMYLETKLKVLKFYFTCDRVWDRVLESNMSSSAGDTFDEHNKNVINVEVSTTYFYCICLSYSLFCYIVCAGCC